MREKDDSAGLAAGANDTTAVPASPAPHVAHTPGPWKVCTTMIWTVGDPYGHGPMRIADIRGWGHLTGQGACAFSQQKGALIQDANAQLIAAAPDYHEAMQNALLDAGELEGDDAGYVAITVDAWRMLKRAHAKAEGRQP